jgi:hypothetical protein
MTVKRPAAFEGQEVALQPPQDRLRLRMPVVAALDVIELEPICLALDLVEQSNLFEQRQRLELVSPDPKPRLSPAVARKTR